MTRPRQNPDQLALIGAERRRIGRVERRVTAAQARRRKEGSLTPADDTLIVLAIALGRGVDWTSPGAPGDSPFALAQLGRALLECEAVLGARAAGGTDAFAAFVHALSDDEGDPPAGH